MFLNVGYKKKACQCLLWVDFPFKKKKRKKRVCVEKVGFKIQKIEV